MGSGWIPFFSSEAVFFQVGCCIVAVLTWNTGLWSICMCTSVAVWTIWSEGWKDGNGDAATGGYNSHCWSSSGK